MKGQGSTEYLVILAVVLVVALIVIGLLGQFTGFGSAGLEQQSKAYWQGTSPLSIQNAKLTNASVQLELQNKLSQKITLKAITFDGRTLNISSISFGAGQTQTLSSVGYTTPCTATGQIYQINSVVFIYDVGGIVNQTQTGDKALYGKCS